MFAALCVVITGYLLGAIPTGYLVVKALKGIDVRQSGSGSTGATNVLRCAGKGPAAFVFFFDIFKGYAAVWLANFADCLGLLSGLPYGNLKLVAMVVALVCLLGHSKSIFLQFQGGKSAACALGAAIAMNALAAAESFGTWLVVLLLSRYVSLASMLAVISSALWMQLNQAPPGYIAYCMLGAVYVVARHRSNIKRLLAGSEPKIGHRCHEQ